jgi:general secretion pathway protein E
MSDGLRTDLAHARQQHRAGAGSVLDVLMRSSSLAPHDLLVALRSEAGVDAVFDASGATPDFVTMPVEAARRLRAVALEVTGDSAPRLGMLDPWDDGRVQEASRHFPAGLPHLVALPAALLDEWLGTGGSTEVDVASGTSPLAATGPVVGFVDDALRAAYQGGASDVHFECDRQGVTVKLRRDGVMSRLARMDDARRAEEVISRIKVLAQLDITERRTPQDGRFRATIAGRSIDLRVSIMPSVFGEDAVLRLLDKANLRSRDKTITLDALGFDAVNVDRIRELIELPHGMLLVTGPTGSGKTTTVYAALSEVNDGLEKIVTIEDPVEYELPGVLQIPVNERKGLTFAKGLRSILRHDPDRILVGEIRDAETAEIAVQSALTGHQVFTTVHANSVFDVTGRFRHFGLDMFGFMFSLNGIVVQRLVRTLCRHCAASRPVEEKEACWLSRLGRIVTRVPRAAGCDACQGTGYGGRRVLAEVHVVDDGFRDLVVAGAPASELRARVAASNVATLQAQSGRWVVEGVTTPEEVKRVVGWQ